MNQVHDVELEQKSFETNTNKKQVFVEQQHLNVAKNKWEETSRWLMYEECIEEGSNKWSHPFLPIVYLPAVKLMSLNLCHENIFTELYPETYDQLIDKLSLSNGNAFDLQCLKRTLRLEHVHQPDLTGQSNSRFGSKIKAVRAASILTGVVTELSTPICLFIRLHQPQYFSELTEIEVPTKFIMIYLSNTLQGVNAEEVGRAFAALITDRDFLEYCYKHPHLDGFELQIKRYLAKCCVLPPLWDHNTRIDPCTISDPRQYEELDSIQQEEEENLHFREQNGLVRSGVPFGGLVRDIKRKAPHYLSDFKGLLNAQIISSVLFMYFACLTAIITFGGLLAKATGNNLAAIECIMGALINGVIYALFSGQPLSLLAATGPILIYETIVFDLCGQFDFDYLTFRFWIGMWVTLFLLIMVASDASALMSLVTRFTEDSFAMMVCAIYISTPVNYLIKKGRDKVFDVELNCANKVSDNGTVILGDLELCIETEKDEATFLMSTILVVFTCLVAIFLTNFKSTPFFAYRVRVMIGQFAVFATIVLMSGFDHLMGLKTDKLNTPEGINPTSPSRGWFIPPFHEKNPTWSIFAAIIPAIVATILVFLGNQITVLIICRKENKLKKGVGFHLDLFLITIIIFVNSMFGLPWFNVAVLLSMGHLEALKVEAAPEAPGARMRFKGFMEQRISALLVSLLLGASVFLTPLLRYVPMPVLYGVFLYLGVSSVKKLEILHRLALFFMPVKYMPDYPFLRRVSLKRVHIYTFAQFSTFVLLWILKSFRETALLFPVVLVLMIWVRQLLEKYFTQDELRMLDEYLPHSTPRPRKAVYQFARHPPETFMSVKRAIQRIHRISIQRNHNTKIDQAF